MKPEEIGLKLDDEFPIGEIRRRLFIEGSFPWNGLVRDLTAQLELEWYKFNRRPAVSPKP